MPRTSSRLRTVTGTAFVVAVLAFTTAATVLAATFDWPDVLRQPADVVLPAFHAGGGRLVVVWFATAWTYALLAVPLLLLPAALRRRDDALLRLGTALGAASVLVSVTGFLRWVLVVPPLADAYVHGDATERAAVAAAWLAQHQLGGALLGEHLGQTLAVAWSTAVAVVALRTGVLPRALGVAGLLAGALYLLNQGEVLAGAVPGVPVVELAGPVGSTAWGLWVAALGVWLLVPRAADARRPTPGGAVPPVVSAAAASPRRDG